MDVVKVIVTLNNQEVEVVVVRKNNKNIYFRIKDDLKLYVTCNKLCTDKYIKNLIKENEVALTKMYQKAQNKVIDDESFWYLGKCYTIIYDESVKQVSFADDFIYAKNPKMLNKFYQSECLRIFKSEVQRCCSYFLKVPNFQLKLRKMTTRWGVCNRSNNTITLNTELLKKEIHLLDYVIIHELCHFYEANHGPKFWQLVAEYYPDYKLARKELRG